MSDAKSEDAHHLEGTTELEQALLTVESKLEETFEVAEHRAQTDDEGGTDLILEQVLDLIYRTFGPAIPYDRIGVAIVEEDGEIVRSRWARSDADSVTMGIGYAAPLEDDAVQTILGSGDPLVVNDLEEYLEEHPDSRATRDIVQEGMRSSLTCPLKSGAKPIGLMVFSSADPGVYTEDHKKIFSHVAAHVTTILERSRMYEKLIDLNWQLRVARDALEYQATHDALTRLYNRSAILEVAEREIARARRQERPLTIVMCDIDHFKSINDTYGHIAGDEVLQAVALRLAGALRSYETVGRYGGEEFLITLYDCDAEDAPHALERLRTAVGADKVGTCKGELQVTISLGGAVSEDLEAELETLIRVADETLYEAKGAGRDRHEVELVDDLDD